MAADRPSSADPLRPPAAGGGWAGWLLALLLAAGLVAAWWWQAGDEPEPAPARVVQPAAAPEPAPAAAPALRDPLEPGPGAKPLTLADLGAALAEVFGRNALKLLQLQDFPRRFVATVDSLGREHSPPLAWPVQPAPGRFNVEEGPAGPRAVAANAARYEAYVALLERVDPAQAVDLYLRLAPLLEAAWRDLGMGERRFHARLLQVIDLLLATPEPAEAPRLQLTPVRGPVAPERPWVRYEYADPGLESLAAGQKILLRMGPAQERRVKASLRRLRAQLVQEGLAPPER